MLDMDRNKTSKHDEVQSSVSMVTAAMKISATKDVRITDIDPEGNEDSQSIVDDKCHDLSLKINKRYKCPNGMLQMTNLEAIN